MSESTNESSEIDPKEKRFELKKIAIFINIFDLALIIMMTKKV